MRRFGVGGGVGTPGTGLALALALALRALARPFARPPFGPLVAGVGAEGGRIARMLAAITIAQALSLLCSPGAGSLSTMLDPGSWTSAKSVERTSPACWESGARDSHA